MPAEPHRPLCASDVLGRDVTDRAGRPLGHVVDLVTEADAEGRLTVTAALVTRGPWGRLLGYERDQVRGPWIIEVIARRLLRHHVAEVAWADLRLPDVGER